MSVQNGVQKIDFNYIKPITWVNGEYNENTQLAIIPISYYQKDDLEINIKERIFNIKVNEAKYKKEKLNVNKNKVTPPKKVLERIKKEKKEALSIYNTITKKRYFDNSFINPINSKITSQFGNARIFNKKLKSFHTGTDFRAPINSKIKAVNNGVVVLAKNRYYAGNSIIIDHGKGIYSSYAHLNKIEVKVGQIIKKGQVIAKSGNTGRSTGPHLHLGLIINAVVVDFLDFKNKFNHYNKSNL